VRYQSFKKSIPRCEIETLWLLLGFCADAPVLAADGPKYRWQLIASLFGNDTGVLSKDYFESRSTEETNKLPPDKDHVTQCQEEMMRFAVLVSSTALNPLPDSDSFLMKMVQKCLLLQAHEYRFSSCAGTSEVLCNLDVTDRTRLSQTWKASHLMKSNAVNALQFTCHAEQNGDGRTTGRMTSLLSLSSLVECCVNLSMTWIQQVPKKKARRSRLIQSLQKLVLDCVDSATKLEESTRQDGQAVSGPTFEEAFAVQTSNTGSLYAAAAYQEAAVRLSVIAAIDGSNLALTKDLRETVSSGQAYHLC